MWPNPQETGDLVAFTEEIGDGKHFLCSALSLWCHWYIMVSQYKVDYDKFNFVAIRNK